MLAFAATLPHRANMLRCSGFSKSAAVSVMDYMMRCGVAPCTEWETTGIGSIVVASDLATIIIILAARHRC